LGADLIVTCSAVMRGTKSIGLKNIVDKACEIAKEGGVCPQHVLMCASFLTGPCL
jgi:hypothetical protein